MIERRFLTFTFCLIIALGISTLAYSNESQAQEPASVERISVEEARSKVQAGDAILVCSYDDKKCEDVLLEGALTRKEFEQKLSSLSKEQEIITYCA